LLLLCISVWEGTEVDDLSNRIQGRLQLSRRVGLTAWSVTFAVKVDFHIRTLR
jgi:hypothetical protein